MADSTEKYSVSNLSLKDMAVSMRTLREIGRMCTSMEDVAEKIVGFFYDNFQDAVTHERELALVRFYKTHPYGRLANWQRGFADRTFPQHITQPHTKCLVLVATAGEKDEWNSVGASRGHQVVPLPNEEAVRAMPMIAQVINDLGYEFDQVLSTQPGFIVAEETRSYNVFFVADAVGSPYIPAQSDFVIPFGIQSVIGFGGMLPSGSLFVVIMFAKSKIPLSTAEIFKSLAVSVKVAIVMFDEVDIYNELQGAREQ